MQTVFLVIASFVLYLVAYHTYGRYLARRIFQLDAKRITPAHVLEDGVDFVPSHKSLVFGHHFTSIAGTGPIVGPAIAVVWGWLPALLWVLIGSIVMGAVHDFGSLVISMRHRGRTIADLSGDVVNRRVRLLFMIVCVIGLWIVLAIFGLIIATIFRLYPQSVLPVFAQIPIAIALGIWIKKGGSMLPASILAITTMYATIMYSASLDWDSISIFPESLTAHISINAIWTIILMVYVFIASVLPVHVLLQPRDFINAWQLLVAMALLLAAILYVHPPIVADFVRMHPEPSLRGTPAPPMLPFLFITVACGAISGFHCLVSSGCSSRQLRNEFDAKPIGYGSMLTEGFLATLVIVACIAGIGLGASGTELTGHALWSEYYARWGGDAGLGDKLAPFIVGSANMIEHLGISHAIATTIMGVFVASFAATTLDSATRLQRYIIAELAGASERDANQLLCAACAYPMPAISEVPTCPECGENRTVSAPRSGGPIRTFIINRFGATTIATISALILALSDIPSRGLANAGLGGLTLWPIFGATNQLLAALALLVISVWLVRSGKPAIVSALPMLFMLCVTAYGLVLLTWDFAELDNLMLMVISLVMLAIEIWIVIEAALLIPRIKRTNAPANAEAL